MESSNTSKRKKRKTRKCLDEIRKRARRAGNSSIEKLDKKNEYFSECNNNTNCLITNKRLTLQIFPKAVRSETITRPVLEELKQKPLLNANSLVNNLVKVKDSKLRYSQNCGAENMASLLDDAGSVGNTVNNQNFSENEVGDFAVYSDNNDEINQGEISSTPQVEIYDCYKESDSTSKSPESLGMQSVSTLTSSPTQSLNEEYGLYEEFMSEIPSYINHKGSFIEDFMQSTKNILQKLFIECNRCSYQECEQGLLKCKKSNNEKERFYSSGRIIVHNPMEYIRRGHSERRASDSSASPRSPAPPPASPDSPAYTFYPHKLN